MNLDIVANIEPHAPFVSHRLEVLCCKKSQAFRGSLGMPCCAVELTVHVPNDDLFKIKRATGHRCHYGEDVDAAPPESCLEPDRS